ncbi:hypothetical protein U1Q18_033132 [Sarracenia purpurea var. burkii]
MGNVLLEWVKQGMGMGMGIGIGILAEYILSICNKINHQTKLCFDSQLVELKAAEEISLKESARLEKEIEEVQELKKKISTMTADEYFAKHPELKKKFDDEIRNDYWGY